MKMNLKCNHIRIAIHRKVKQSSSNRRWNFSYTSHGCYAFQRVDRVLAAKFFNTVICIDELIAMPFIIVRLKSIIKLHFNGSNTKRTQTHRHILTAKCPAT